MADAFTGEIRAFAFTFAPYNWAACDGAAVNINQNPALYAVIGSYYGGDQKTYFNLPNLQGRVPVCQDFGVMQDTFPIGRSTGTEQVTLTNNPEHFHVANAGFSTNATAGDNVPNSTDYLGRVFSALVGYFGYSDQAPNATLHPITLGAAGSQSPTGHENRQPVLTMLYCICTNGDFPIRP